MAPAPSLVLPITSLYAGLCCLLYLILTVAVVRMRREMKIPYGDGGQRLLKKRIAVRPSIGLDLHFCCAFELKIQDVGKDLHINI